jgi:hypothetical protein
MYPATSEPTSRAAIILVLYICFLKRVQRVINQHVLGLHIAPTKSSSAITWWINISAHSSQLTDSIKQTRIYLNSDTNMYEWKITSRLCSQHLNNIAW